MKEKNRPLEPALAKQLRRKYRKLGRQRIERNNLSFYSIELITEMYLRNMRYRSEDDFVERGLQRAAENEPYNVQGKYRDIGWTGEHFRYEYLRVVNRLCPDIFQELRELLPLFRVAFTSAPWRTRLSGFELPGKIPQFLEPWAVSTGRPANREEEHLENLLGEIGTWTKRNNLDRGWVLDYVMVSFEIFLNDDGTKAFTIPDLRESELFTPPFIFPPQTWKVATESIEEFEHRCIAELKERLERFRSTLGEFLQRAERRNEICKVAGRPFDLEHLEWLAYWNFGASAGEIAAKFHKETQTVNACIRSLRKSGYDLPIRRGRSGRDERLFKLLAAT